MSNTTSRRAFLAQSAVALATAPFALNTLTALPRGASSLTGAMMLPEQPDDASLRALATVALEAAKNAGASYADIRACGMSSLNVGLASGSDRAGFGLGTDYSYGIRVLVDGAMAFTYGTRMNAESVAAAARDAVASARGLAGRLRTVVELAPAPVVTGEWSSPLQIDPFTVPIQEQADVIGSYWMTARKVKYGDTETIIGLQWRHETRIFASTDGTMQVQRFRTGSVNVGVIGEIGRSTYQGGVPGPLAGSAGFELAIAPDLPARILRGTEEAVRLASFPTTTFDVGRYDVVTAGAGTASILGATLVPALELDRALGHEASGMGSTFLAPPLEVLGQQMFSPLISVTSDRTSPSNVTARWDDDGVACAPLTVIEKGRVVDYFTSRFTATALRPWYERSGKPVRSNGNAMVQEGCSRLPLPRPGSTRMTPSAAPASVDELCKGIKQGLLLIAGARTSSDQQFASVAVGGDMPPTPLFEITNGRITRRIIGNMMQVNTRTLWSRSLKRIGDASTMGESVCFSQKAQPYQRAFLPVEAPAAYFADVDVIRMGAAR